MPKRVADSIITKEHGSTPNGPDQDDKPRMSTAAQQARRKIAQPRGRLGASRSHTPSNTVPNPFSQNPPQQQTFGALNGGITFGASQSFPQSSAGDNNSFNFQPPQSSSFTFGAPSGPNPFENLNGTGNSQDISMESPQKKAALGNTFGSNSVTFSQPAQEQSNPFGGFGGKQTTAMNGNNLFGQQTATSTTSDPFGPPAQSQTFGGFAQQPPASQPQTSGFGGFGQTTNASTPATSASFGGFGQPATTTGQSPLPALGTQETSEPQSQPKQSKFTFGQTSSTSQSLGTGLFGSVTPATGSTGGNLFSSAQPTPAGFSLDQSSSQTAAPSNPFAIFGSTKPEEPKPAAPSFGGSASTSQQASFSAEKATHSGSNARSLNPFGSPLGGVSSAPQATSGQQPLFGFGTPSHPPAPAAEKQEATSAKPTFAFGTTSQPTAVSAADESRPKPAKSPFSFGATSQSAASAADGDEPKSSISNFQFGSAASRPGTTTSGFFGRPAVPEKAETSDAALAPTVKFSGPSQSVSSGGLFSPTKPPSENPASSGGLFSKLNSAVETSAKSKPLFGGPPKETSGGFSSSTSAVAAESSTRSAETPKTTTAPLFGSQSRQAAEQPQAVQRPQFASKDFGATPAQTPFHAAATSTVQGLESSSDAASTALALPPTKRPVYTKGPSRVPGHTNAQQFQEYDRNYRLHSLNHGLQQKLASLDPRSHDFDNVIRHYVAARDNIGASLGLYVRNVAGTKRKGDQVDDREDESEQKKRSREDSVPKSSSFGSTALAPSTAIKAVPVPANTAKSLNDTISKSASTTTTGFSQPATGFKPAANTFGGSASASSNPFANLNQTPNLNSSVASTTPTKSPPKKPGFEMPKIASGGGTNFLAAFGQQAKANAAKFEKDLLEKRKAEEFDSDEDDEEAYRKQVEEETRAKRAKIDAIAQGGFTPTFGAVSEGKAPKPVFGGFGNAARSTPEENKPKPTFASFDSATSSNSFSALTSASKQKETKPSFAGFGSAASPNIAAAISDAQASADYDDEDDGDYTDDKDDDDYEVNGSSNDQAEDEDEDESGDAYEAEDSLPGDEVAPENGDDDEDDDDNDLQAALDRSRRNPNAGKSLFERIEPNPNMDKSTPTTNGHKPESKADTSPILQSAKNSSFPPAVWGSHIGKSTPEQPAFSPFTPTTVASTAKPASTFKFTPVASTTTPAPAFGSSIFSGGATRDGPVPGEGLFGSRPSTPSNAEPNGGLAKSVLTSPAGTDNTWKQGSTISFGNGGKPANAPSFKFTAASPGEKDKNSQGWHSLGALFGTPTADSSGTATPNLGFKFGGPASGPAPGYLGAVSHLGGGSAASSVASSRATSPGLTDNESVATNETEETTDDPQTSLMDSRTGEENETTLWEGRSKALMFVNDETAKGTKYKANEWNSVGVGMIRVLKDKISNRTRMVFRVEPSANILFNSHLVESTSYESLPGNKSGAVRGALIYKGNLTRLVFKLKTPEMANELSKILEENKSA